MISVDWCLKEIVLFCYCCPIDAFWYIIIILILFVVKYETSVIFTGSIFCFRDEDFLPSSTVSKSFLFLALNYVTLITLFLKPEFLNLLCLMAPLLQYLKIWGYPLELNGPNVHRNMLSGGTPSGRSSNLTKPL